MITLLPLACLKRYFFKVCLCNIIRHWFPPPVVIGKIECSVHLYSSPCTRKPESKKFFAITFIGSILWIAVFSYLMVWWATVTGEAFSIPPEVKKLIYIFVCLFVCLFVCCCFLGGRLLLAVFATIVKTIALKLYNSIFNSAAKTKILTIKSSHLSFPVIILKYSQPKKT